MPQHSHEEEHEEPVSFQDKRRIDPETGKVRQPAGGVGDGDALSQAERILNDAAAQGGENQGGENQRGANQGGGDQTATDEQAAPAGTTGEAGAEGADAPAGAEPSVREEELRNDLLRVQAEFVNYKRRVERDRNVARDSAIQSVLAALLPVLDDLDAARSAGDLAEGPFAAIAGKFDTVLSGFGLERQDQEALAGQPFDPAQHEAMLRQPSAEVPAEHIVQVFRNGYVRDGRVLRAAQVMVSAGAEG